jgi:hypothetical protein
MISNIHLALDCAQLQRELHPEMSYLDACCAAIDELHLADTLDPVRLAAALAEREGKEVVPC